MKEKKNYFLGIDLGTTNSAIAWGQVLPRGEQVVPRVIDVDQVVEGGSMARRSLLPSSVYFAEGKTPLVGDFARSMAGVQASRVVRSVKSSMGGGRRFQFDTEGYSPSEISSFILRHLAQSAQRLLGFLPDDVVITVPASFDSDMRKATIEAAAQAGFKVAEDDGSPRNILLDEPRAALYDFVNRQVRGEIPDSLVDFTKSKNVMVFDLGGGTLDVSFHKVRFGSDRHLDVEDYAISRYTKIGGDDFDRALARRFMDDFSSKVPMKGVPDEEQKSLEQRFLRYAEEAKVELVKEMESRSLLGISDGSDVVAQVLKANVLGDVPFEYDLSYDEFLDVIFPLMGNEITMDMVDGDEVVEDRETIMTPVVDVLCKVKDKIGELPHVDVVLLNGGMTRLPAVRDRLARFFGVQPVSAGDPDMAVVRGAVAYHYNLHRGIRIGAILNDTIGIETAGGRVKHIVQAGTALPYRSPVIKDFAVIQDGASFVDLPFYLGRRNDTAQPNRRIASRRVRFNRPLRAGDVMCLQVVLDERSIMSLEGWPENRKDEGFKVTVQSDGEYEEAPVALKSKPGGSVGSFGLGRQKAVPSGPTLSVENSLANLMDLYEMAARYAFNPDRCGMAMGKVRIAEKAIISSANGGEFVGEIVRLLGQRSVRGLAQSRLIYVLGELGARHVGHRDEIVKAAMFMCSAEKISHLPSVVVNTTFRYALEAVGKVGDKSVDKYLLSFLGCPSARGLWGSALFSLGKVGAGEDGFRRALELTKSLDKGTRIAALWAVAMMGSRQRGLVSSQSAAKAMDSIMSGIDREYHQDAIRNALFAVGELGDRRSGCAPVLDSAMTIARKTIAKIRLRLERERFTTEKVLKSFCNIASAMVEGDVLSVDQEKSLLGLRSMLA